VSRPHRFIVLLLGLLALVFASATACARPQADLDAALAAYERDAWPAALSAASFAPERGYLILLQVVPAHALDLGDLDHVRDYLRRSVVDGLLPFQAKTLLGHMMVAWQCGGRRGMAGVSGERSNQGLKMMMAGGWGATPILSVYRDGRVETGPQFNARYGHLLKTRRSTAVAFEIAPRGCERMRRFLADFLTHPARPASRYGLLPDPARFEGAGCVSFVVAMAAAAGVWQGRQEQFERKIRVSERMLGRRKSVPPGVEPFRPLKPGDEEVSIGWLELTLGSWTDGPAAAEVRILDPELVYAVLVEMRARAGAAPSWREDRRLASSDPDVADAIAVAARLLRPYAHRRFERVQGFEVLVLER
jgi:hypothetical protein